MSSSAAPRRYRAAWVLPMTGAPIRDGWVAVADERIDAVGDGRAGDAIDLGRVALLPALVNAHTHLELSHLAGRVPPAESFLAWVRALLRERFATPASPQEIDGAIDRAIEASRAAGTGLVGDVANTPATIPRLARAGMPATVFHEILGFNAADPDALVRTARSAIDAAIAGAGAPPDLRASVVPHAPYSVSPALFRAIRADADAHPDAPLSVHAGESPEEVEFVRAGTGPWRALLQDLCAWNEGWQPPGTSTPRYLDGLGFLDRRVSLVHGVQFTGDDLDLIGRRGCGVIVCPRSNRHVGVGDPPLAAFYARGLPVAVGTDSLASAPDLNVFSELAAMRRLAPHVEARRLLASATVVGARLLGANDGAGTLSPGSPAGVIAVTVPEGVEDVEEYLLTGILPSQVAWVGGLRLAPPRPMPA